MDLVPNLLNTLNRIAAHFRNDHHGQKAFAAARMRRNVSPSLRLIPLACTTRWNSRLAQFAEFTVVPFDTVVAEDKVYVWKKGERRKAERVLSGGTCFNAPTRYVNDRSFDGHIVLTDMMAPKPIASKCQRMWMTTAEYAHNPYFSTNEVVVGIDRK